MKRHYHLKMFHKCVVGWLFRFYGISTIEGYLMPFLYK